MSSNMLATSSRGTSLPSRIAPMLLLEGTCENGRFPGVGPRRGFHQADAKRRARGQVRDCLDGTCPEREVAAEEHLADRHPLPVDLDPAAVLAVTCRLGQPVCDHRE